MIQSCVQDPLCRCQTAMPTSGVRLTLRPPTPAPGIDDYSVQVSFFDGTDWRTLKVVYVGHNGLLEADRVNGSGIQDGRWTGDPAAKNIHHDRTLPKIKQDMEGRVLRKNRYRTLLDNVYGPPAYCMDPRAKDGHSWRVPQRKDGSILEDLYRGPARDPIGRGWDFTQHHPGRS